jgi:hypothetical protein
MMYSCHREGLSESCYILEQGQEKLLKFSRGNSIATDGVVRREELKINGKIETCTGIWTDAMLLP